MDKFKLNQIVLKEELNPTVTKMEVYSPFIAKKAEPGEFIILRVDEVGERIPLTIAGYDREKGTVTIIFQIVGGTTMLLNGLNEGDQIHDFVGPLGKATETEVLTVRSAGVEAENMTVRNFFIKKPIRIEKCKSITDSTKVGLGFFWIGE